MKSPSLSRQGYVRQKRKPKKLLRRSGFKKGKIVWAIWTGGDGNELKNIKCRAITEMNLKRSDKDFEKSNEAILAFLVVVSSDSKYGTTSTRVSRILRLHCSDHTYVLNGTKDQPPCYEKQSTANLLNVYLHRYSSY